MISTNFGARKGERINQILTEKRLSFILIFLY